jgi:hypothetical protein
MTSQNPLTVPGIRNLQKNASEQSFENEKQRKKEE